MRAMVSVDFTTDDGVTGGHWMRQFNKSFITLGIALLKGATCHSIAKACAVSTLHEPGLALIWRSLSKCNEQGEFARCRIATGHIGHTVIAKFTISVTGQGVICLPRHDRLQRLNAALSKAVRQNRLPMASAHFTMHDRDKGLIWTSLYG